MQLKCKTPAQGQGAPAESPTEAMPRHQVVQLPCTPFYLRFDPGLRAGFNSLLYPGLTHACKRCYPGQI